MYFLKSWLDDSKKYREKREAEEAELKKQREKEDQDWRRGQASVMEALLLSNYDKCSAEGVYSIERRTIYRNMYQTYKNLGYDGRMKQICENILKIPDEYGQIHEPEEWEVQK